jgi:hypothetical protein
MIALTRRMAAWEAEASCSSGHFADDAKASGSGEGVSVDDAEASRTDNRVVVIDVSSCDQEDI